MSAQLNYFDHHSWLLLNHTFQVPEDIEPLPATAYVHTENILIRIIRQIGPV